jgi:RNA polymerase sigma factor (sigma-70 family)
MNTDFIKKIKGGNTSLLDDFYIKYRSGFIQWAIKKFSISTETATDIFQDVMIAFYENIMANRLTVLTCDLKTYLYQIGRNKLVDFTKKESRAVTFNQADWIKEYQVENEFVAYNNTITINNQLNNYLSALCDNCQMVLKLFYLQELSLKEVAALMGYKNADVAKKKRYECFKKLTAIYNPKQKGGEIGRASF